MRVRAPRLMAYQYASPGYAGCFGNLPKEPTGLRQAALAYMKGFDPKRWHDDPVVTLLAGETLAGGKRSQTVDCFGTVNGAIVQSTPAEVDKVLKTLKAFTPPRDYRRECRLIEDKFMSLPLAGELIGNQALDFHKQDGITEIEESVQANEVERRLQDALFESEQKGEVQISRSPAFVGCVSNFSNFLDLCRKVLRNMELGVPCIVLARSNTTQHMFRWTQRLLELMREHKIDLRMLTYLSCEMVDVWRCFSAFPDSAAYFTCSREVAKAVKEKMPRLMSSAGGPNTMVNLAMNPETLKACVQSNLIENKGQCTALRHAVLPGATDAMVQAMYKDNAVVVDNVQQSMEQGQFMGILKHANSQHRPDAAYKQLETAPLVKYRLGASLPATIEEKWREPAVDITAPTLAECQSPEFREQLAVWLNTFQPISLAVNGDADFALDLFEKTGLVVYTVGSADKPALTCQARPQSGETFGEFPPRRELHTYTHLPVVIPSSTPGYNSTYTDAFLAQHAGAFPAVRGQSLAKHVSPRMRGYLALLAEYLAASCGPKRSEDGAPRTALFGLQRPPLLGSKSILRLSAPDAERDAPYLLPFVMTNAWDNLEVSVDAVPAYVAELGLEPQQVVVETQAQFEQRLGQLSPPPYNVVRPELVDGGAFLPLLAMHWVSRLFPLGHVKSSQPGDGAFVTKFEQSRKWLRVRAEAKL